MEIRRIGTQPSAKGPSEWFTGTVRIDPLFQAPDPALVQAASVTFEPARGLHAYTSPRSDSHRHGWLWQRATVGRPYRGNSAG
jgi:quercetin dioxygenase-like cupin family protein